MRNYAAHLSVLVVGALTACTAPGTSRDTASGGKPLDQFGRQTAAYGQEKGGDTNADGGTLGKTAVPKQSAASDVPARHSEMTRVGDRLHCKDGRVLVIIGVVSDQAVVDSLESALTAIRDIEAKSMRVRSWCYGGYEVCYDRTVYVYYVTENSDKTCTGRWFATDTACP